MKTLISYLPYAIVGLLIGLSLALSV